MAEAPVNIKAPPVEAPKLPSSGSLTIPTEGLISQDPATLEAAQKFNHASETMLNGDKATFGRADTMYNYNNSLIEGTSAREPGQFAEASSAYENRDLTPNSGPALRGQQRIAAKFQGRENTAALKLKQFGEKQAEGAQNRAGIVGQEGGRLTKEAEGFLAAKALKKPNEAPPPLAPGYAAAAQQYPNAAAAASAAFPGGVAEQRAWIKWKAAGGQGNAPGVTGNFAQRAKGGPVEAGHAYIVGEKGPEVMVPKTGGQILPNHAGPKAQQIRRRAIERLGRWNGGRNKR